MPESNIDSRPKKTSAMPIYVKVGGRLLGYVWVKEPTQVKLAKLVDHLRSTHGEEVVLSVPTIEEFEALGSDSLEQLLIWE